MRIVLQTTGEQVSHEPDDRVVEAAHMTLLNGSIIFVNDDDRCDSVVLMEEQRQCPQGHLIFHFVSGFCCKKGIFLFFVITKCGTGCQLVVTAEFLCDQLLERLIGFFPRGVFNILEGQEDHRVLSMVSKIGFSAEPDFLISEVNGSVLGRLFEESAEHIHVKRLAKASGAGK